MLLAVLPADDSLGVDELVVNSVVFAALSYLARRCGRKEFSCQTTGRRCIRYYRNPSIFGQSEVSIFIMDGMIVFKLTIATWKEQ
jgi:hypothetical protein